MPTNFDWKKTTMRLLYLLLVTTIARATNANAAHNKTAHENQALLRGGANGDWKDENLELNMYDFEMNDDERSGGFEEVEDGEVEPWVSLEKRTVSREKRHDNKEKHDKKKSGKSEKSQTAKPTPDRFRTGKPTSNTLKTVKPTAHKEQSGKADKSGGNNDKDKKKKKEGKDGKAEKDMPTMLPTYLLDDDLVV